MPNADEILERKAIRITPMRQLLLTYFLTKNKITGLAELEKEFPRADRITLYRTLKTFEEKGIVHSIPNGTSEVKYALCNEYCTVTQHVDNHPHFHCIKCKMTECLDSVLVSTPPLPKGYFPKKIEITIEGVCGRCG